MTPQLRKIAHRYQRRYEAIEDLLHAPVGSPDSGKEHDKLIFRAQFFYFMGEVEAVFQDRHSWSCRLMACSQLLATHRRKHLSSLVDCSTRTLEAACDALRVRKFLFPELTRVATRRWRRVSSMRSASLRYQIKRREDCI